MLLTLFIAIALLTQCSSFMSTECSVLFWVCVCVYVCIVVAKSCQQTAKYHYPIHSLLENEANSTAGRKKKKNEKITNISTHNPHTKDKPSKFNELEFLYVL